MTADEIYTKRQALAVFGRSGSGRLIMGLCAVALVVRLVLGGWSWVDPVIVIASLVLVGGVEWTIHLFLLHAPLDSLRTRLLGTGKGHYEHHRDPNHLGWLLLGWADVAVFSVLIAVGSAAWTGLLALATGAPLVPVAATGVLTAYLLLGHYEWTHLLVHTRYRPQTRYYRRLALHHRMHHHRDERQWLGITSNLADYALGTAP